MVFDEGNNSNSNGAGAADSLRRSNGGPPTSNDNLRLQAKLLLMSAVVPCAAGALARLNVFEVLAQAGEGAQLTAAEIAALAVPGKSINVSYLARLLRMMCGSKVLRETVVSSVRVPATTDTADVVTERRYSLEPIGRYFVEDAENGSFVHMLMAGQMGELLRTWEHLHESVLDDSVPPFARAHGGLSAWEYMKQNPEFGKLFNKAQSGPSKVYMRAVLDAYQGFHDVKVLVDVGGGLGSALSLITARYPQIRGINFDQPHVIDACPDLPRVENVGGNFFEAVPKGGDAIFMKYILHDWDDESCRRILRNCYAALPEHGKVITVDILLPEVINPDGGGDALALRFDVHMLALHDPGTGARSEADYCQLAFDAGFKHAHVVCKADFHSVAEFRK